MYSGSFVALITPMTVTGALDEPALRKLVDWHLECGTNGLVPAGTTGESATLSGDERRRVLDIVVEMAGDKVPVIAGCGSNNTQEALELHDYAHNIGASAALHVTGYYNRPNQEGIYRHFEALSQRNTLPIIVYNVPPRTIVDISAETMAGIAELKSVVGVKDATKDLARPVQERLSIQSEFYQLSGEDATAVAYNAAGGTGCISVTANVAPEQCAKMQKACLADDFKEAGKIQDGLMPLHDALFVDPSPSGVKYACSKLGLCGDHVRLPLVAVSTTAKLAIDEALLKLGMD